MSRAIYDAIVVGARCAGAPTAMLLARSGCRVLLVDRCSFPSDTISTHYIHQLGVARLKQWGLLGAIQAQNCPPIRRVSIHSGPKTLETFFMEFDTRLDAYCMRRIVLDQLLVEAAVAAGAEFRDGLVVEDLLHSGRAVTGIRGRSRRMGAVEERARIVIGADGSHSLIATRARAPRYAVAPARSCYVYSYWRGLPLTGGEIYFRGGRAATAFPTNDALTCVTLGWPKAQASQLHRDLPERYAKGLALFPPLHARLARAERVDGLRVWWGRADNYFRRPYGPGWALVGDAGYHKDPITALGITDAFRDADLLANAVVSGLSGGTSLSRSLARYERARNDAAAPLYNFTLEIAALGKGTPHPRPRPLPSRASVRVPAGRCLYLDRAVT